MVRYDLKIDRSIVARDTGKTSDIRKISGSNRKTVLNQAVRRNRNRFPPDFMFPLTREEIRNISQIVMCSEIKS
ncbi:MAG: ORF6N domain-containing protein [Deltaproteobacteria bacterium]|nr:ORF6N domain-containing protein [Deltaproteobacteria bacterium]